MAQSAGSPEGPKARAVAVEAAGSRAFWHRVRMVSMAACASFAAATLALFPVSGMTGPVPQAQAVTYNQLQNARGRARSSAARAARLRSQLSGVSASLQNQIVALDDLNNNQIPAAQQAADQATQQAQQARINAQQAQERLQASQKDESDLKAKIRQTGKDYDDAHAALAEVARNSMHGSAASDTMSVVMGAKSAKQFVDSMQSNAAVSRSEATVADNSAEDLSLSANRQQRLQAITARVAQLKSQADQQQVSAEKAQADAQQKQQQLQALVDQGNQRRAQLESQKSQLTTSAAREAANAVALQSQLDSMSQQWNAQRAAAAANAARNAASQQGTRRNPRPSRRPSNTRPSSSHSNGSHRTNTPSRGNSRPISRPGNSTSGHFSSGDTGKAYPFSQCTWWVYIRRHQLGLPCGSYFGNGGQWANSARAHGYRVDRTPSAGAIMVFAPGQDGSSPVYGHVAVVERVNGNGTVTTSECGARLHGRPVTRTRVAAGHWFIH